VTDHQSAAATDDVVARLRALGHELVIPPPDDDVLTAVLSRIDREPIAARGNRARHVLEAGTGWLRQRRRMVVAVLVAALVIVLGASPVGAKVREWLGFGAVVVQEDSAPSASLQSSSPDAPGSIRIPLDEVGNSVSFPVGRPALIRAPDSVVVSTDHRLVTMAWSGGDLPGGANEVRLDQVSGSMHPYFFKKYFPDVDFVRVNEIESLWLRQSHPIVVLNPDGTQRSESARLSGPALIWQHEGVTLRLEGVSDLSSARAVAESMTY
jgi:hypothetical protein